MTDNLPDEESNDNNLPGLLPSNIIKEPTTQVTTTSTLEEVKKADLEVTNNVLSALHCMWGKATSISQVTRLCQATMQTLKSRRELLCMQYGSPASRNSNEIIPID